MDGLLHSTTTNGMPFTNSTRSGTMNCLALLKPGGQSTRYWLMTVKRFVGWCVPVDVAEGSDRARRPSRAGPRRSALDQQLSGLLVGLHELVRAEPGDGGHGFRQAGVVQPRRAIGAGVKGA